MQIEVPSRREPMVAQGTEVIGGPVGRYARVGRRGLVAAAAVLSALASVMVALGVLRGNHCLREDWSSPGSLWRMCYSDLPADAAGTGGPFAALGPGQSEPFLTALLTWIVRAFVPSSQSGAGQQQWYFAIAAMLIVVFVAMTVTALTWMMPARPWRAAMVALSPLLVTSALISFDLFGVALMTVGLAAWVRRYPWLAGAFLGAATMARSFPVLALIAVVLVGLRVGRREDVRKVLTAAVGVVIACLALASVLGGNPFAPYQTWAKAEPTYGSIGLIAQICGLDVFTGDTGALAGSIIAVTGWIAALIIGRHLTRGPRPSSVVAVTTVMLVIVMITAKSNPVQAALWLLPLLAASRLPWGDYLVWAGVEVVAFAATWLYVGSGFDDRNPMPGAAYVLFAALRLMMLGFIAWRVWDLEPRPASAASTG